MIDERVKKELMMTELERTSGERQLTTTMTSFANTLKNGLGEEIRSELNNPSKPNKKAGKRLKRARFWGKLKEDLKQLFFKGENNDNYTDFLRDDEDTEI